MIEALLAYLPVDRCLALVGATHLQDRAWGSALLADISGFTQLTEALATELGPQRGAEEISRHLNLVYEALIAELYQFGGTVINFSGDAITCWFEGDGGRGAAASGLAMQQAMQQFHRVTIPSGRAVSLAMKVAIATGPARRFIVGDPNIQLIDVLVGATLDDLAAAAQASARGEVLLDPSTMAATGASLVVAEQRAASGGRTYSVVSRLAEPVAPAPWPDAVIGALGPELVRPWVLPAVYERLGQGLGDFLAELRPAVALFVHFAGIDSDSDEAPARLDAFVRGVQRIVSSYEGTLLQLTFGDKGSYLYAGFGAPVAHEDDALRAVNAALEVRALSGRAAGLADVRVGVSQGRMWAGAYGGRTRRTYGLLGDDVNLAARLMTAAAPGQVLASRSVRASTGDAFLWGDMPDLAVKGKAQPVAVCRLEGINERRATLAGKPQAAGGLVGRYAELEAARLALVRALGGHGQVVALTGEAGLGKSRLVGELARMAAEGGMRVYAGECVSYGENASYLVWQPIWRGLFGLDPAWAPERQIDAINQRLAEAAAQLVLRMPLLGPLLSLEIANNDLTRSFDARLRKTSLESLLVDSLRHMAGQAPLLLVLENCQWVDALSMDLLEALARTIVDVPVLIALAYRPLQAARVSQSPLSGLPHFVELRLQELDPGQTRQLAASKLQDLFGREEETHVELLERVATRAAGNPFYVEALLRYLSDRGINPRDAQALEALELPASLHSLVLARIDTLAEREAVTLRVASVVGRQFGADLLSGAFPQIGPDLALRGDLESLTRMEMTLREPGAGQTYLFRQIVTQEVAYESLPHALRSTLHNQAGGYLERTQPRDSARRLDELAYHFGRSDNLDKQRHYLLMAGEAARANYANAAALDYFRRALPLLDGAEQVAVMLKLGQVLELTGQWQEANARYSGALDRAVDLGDLALQARCQSAMAELMRKRGAYAEAGAWLWRAHSAFSRMDDRAGTGQVLHFAGTLAAQQGDYEQAKALYEQSLRIRQDLDDEANVANLLSNLAIMARYQGDSDLARQLNEQSLAVRRRVGDRRAIAISLNNLGNLALDQGQFDEAEVRLREALAIQREVGDRAYVANALDNLGNVLTAQGNFGGARDLYRESLVTNQQLGDRWSLAYVLEDVGCLAARQGQPGHALGLVSAAAQLRQSLGSPLPPAEREKLSDRLVAAGLSPDEAARALAGSANRPLSLEQAVALAERDVLRPPGGPAQV